MMNLWSGKTSRTERPVGGLLVILFLELVIFGNIFEFTQLECNGLEFGD